MPFFADIQDKYVRIVKSGTVQGTDLADAAHWGGYSNKVWGDRVSQLWGCTWTPADINSSGFGVAISGQCVDADGAGACIDYVKIRVTYSLPGMPHLQYQYGTAKAGP
jgi:hypothetical protein